MAKVGLSKSYAAPYTYDSGTGRATYSGGMSIGKAVSVDIAVNTAADNDFYADNGVAESAKGFGGGTLTVTDDRMPLAAAAMLLGLEVAQNETPAGTIIDFPADSAAPYVGYGTVAKHIMDGVDQWRAIILLKVQFNVPAVSGTTQGQTITFEGNQITANILRSDDEEGRWMRWGDFATEANADAWVKSVLGIT